jgi:hypothetical protein
MPDTLDTITGVEKPVGKTRERSTGETEALPAE